jgi:hypothetical protein
VTVVVANAVVAPSDAPPQVTLRSQKGSIPANGDTVLEWTASNARECIASGAWSGTKSKQGSQKIQALKGDATFTLSCQGTGGTAIAMTHVALQRATLRWEGGTSNHTAFRVLWGKRADQPENQLTITNTKARQQIIDLPGAGTYYFILATLDASNREIGRSNTASKQLLP